MLRGVIGERGSGWDGLRQPGSGQASVLVGSGVWNADQPDAWKEEW